MSEQTLRNWGNAAKEGKLAGGAARQLRWSKWSCRGCAPNVKKSGPGEAAGSSVAAPPSDAGTRRYRSWGLIRDITVERRAEAKQVILHVR